MRLFIALIITLLFQFGCGSDDSSKTSEAASPLASLQGIWLIEINASCGYGLTIKDEQYMFNTLCIDGNKGYNEMEIGSISSDGQSLTMTNQKNSCQGTPISTDVYKYSLSPTGKVLNLYLPGGMAAFQKFEENSEAGNYVVQHGCFNENDEFVPTPDFAP